MNEKCDMFVMNMAMVDYSEIHSNDTNDLLQNISNYYVNQSNQTINIYPYNLQFNKNNLTVVIVYLALFFIAAVGNLTVFVSLFKSRHRKSRISLMILHLAIADSMVTFIMIPLEVRHT